MTMNFVSGREEGGIAARAQAKEARSWQRRYAVQLRAMAAQPCAEGHDRGPDIAGEDGVRSLPPTHAPTADAS